MMSTPTLSMQIFGQMQQEEGIKRRRSEAAKKAWRTRRRRARPTPAMRRILEHLTKKPNARIYGHGNKSLGLCGVRLTETYYSREGRMSQLTLRGLMERRWIEVESESRTGGTMGTMPDGSHGIVDPSFSRYYRITEKGRKAMESN